MNLLAIDFGKKNIGTAISIDTIIQPMSVYGNNVNILKNLSMLINDYKIEKIVLGYTKSKNLKTILDFKIKLEAEYSLPVELVDENLTTKEAQTIYKKNRNFHKKNIVDKVDSIAAAVLLSRYV